MDIESAFTEQAISAYGTDVEGEEEEQLKTLLTQIYVSNEINWSDDIMRVAMLAFVAGRTYQMDEALQVTPGTVDVPMDGETVGAFMKYLLQKGES